LLFAMTTTEVAGDENFCEPAINRFSIDSLKTAHRHLATNNRPTTTHKRTTTTGSRKQSGLVSKSIAEPMSPTNRP